MADDFLQALRVVEELESRLPVTPDRITDITDGDFSELHSQQLVAVAERRKNAPLKNKIKSAIVAPKPDQYGLARMFAGFNQNSDITIMIFKDSTSAYEWLGRSPAA